MFDAFRQGVLKLMRVPHAPEPPSGAPTSVRIFRAGRNFYYVRLVAWAVAQLGAVIGILFSLGFLYWFKIQVHALQQPPPVPAVVAPATPPPAAAPAKSQPPNASGPSSKSRVRRPGRTRDQFVWLAQRTPEWAIWIIEIIEIGGILLFLGQLAMTAVMVRLEFELHWYIVTDRSLRIRTGLLSLQESTMSFANLQQVEVQQGPLQRLLGLADVRVQSAGGGADHDARHARETLHTGIFHGVENATEIRDLILERLRRFRETGLGDPDEHHPAFAAPAGANHASAEETLAAARELLTEAKALRWALN